jgi:peptidoglycan pentaglycine glycine transferase (the first glycine)
MLEVKEINEKNVWDAFLREAKPNTFLQSWQWADFNARIKASPTRFGVYRSNELIALALVLLVKARRGTFVLCPQGPAIKETEQADEIITVLTSEFKTYALKNNASFIRFAPLLLKNSHNEDIFAQLGYRNAPVHLVHPELAWVLDVTPDEETLLRGMRKSTRYSIKKAEKDGVTISISTDAKDLEKFWQVYAYTVKRQHFAAFTKEFLQAEFETFARDHRAAFFFAHYQNEITATALIVFDEHAGYYHHAATTQKYPGLTDAQLLQWSVIKECKKRGLTKYNFWGVVPEDLKNHPWSGLSTFKRGFGGREEEYVHAKDLPLSWRYWLTYIFEKIRRWKRGL